MRDGKVAREEKIPYHRRQDALHELNENIKNKHQLVDTTISTRKESTVEINLNKTKTETRMPKDYDILQSACYDKYNTFLRGPPKILP
jgi:hypothetical protein